jgi:predicted anti-sigma-YlaC factor YlaD
MVDPHTAATTASVAAASSLLTLAAVVYLRWNSNRSLEPSSQRAAAITPEPGPHNAAQHGTLFIPVSKQKRPDPYDPSPRNT